jgi:hypothetical protein
LNMVPTVDFHILPACTNIMGMGCDTVDFMEMSNFWGKHEAFRLFIRHTFKKVPIEQQTYVTLLDDAVMNEQFEWPDLRIIGRIINIDSI